jgi:hypothetical protein
MNRRLRIYSKLSLLAFATLAGALCLLDTHSPSFANSLSGGIQHLEKLEQLDSKLRSEAPFIDNPKTEIEDSPWKEIPSWLAGTWRSVQMMEIGQSEDRNSDAGAESRILPIKESETFGFQSDAKRVIWTMSRPLSQFVRFSTSATKSDSDHKSASVVHIRRFYRDIDSDSPRSVVVRFIDTKLHVKPDEKKIAEVEREEVIRKIVLLEPDLIAVSSDVQTYDSEGFPFDHRRLVEFRRRDRKYETINQAAGINLHASFTKFLETHQMIDRDPEVH